MKIEKLDHYGRGITYIDDKICFIENALPGEDVEIDFTKKKKKYMEAKTIEISHESLERVAPECKYYNQCGGCNLMHFNEKMRTVFKENKVREIMDKFLSYEGEIKKIEHNQPYHYRNKVVLHVENGKLGFYRNHTNDLICIDECLLLNHELNHFIIFLKDYIKEERSIRKITIKIGNKTNEMMLIIDGYVKDYSSLLDKVDVLIINNKILTKKDYIISMIGTKKYQVSQNSFFQVNQYMTENLYHEILENIKRAQSKYVLDLYCGTGTIGIYIADAAEKVVGIEVVEDAIKDANKNKILNHTNNIEFILGKVEEKINDIHMEFDTIIVDPPRSGLHKNVIQVIEKIKPKNIIYVSCDPITLARDLNLLKDEYQVEYIKPFDMFPNTYHVEVCCYISRKEDM